MGVELAAVEAMLDHIHEDPFSNKNSYTLGRMGAHNIVIAVMPEIGNNTAATVATQLLNDFKSIRFGLLVGIGGGIPVEDEYDIRLGDVVVSKSTGPFGGVVQFDRGKILSGGTFERTGSLNKPPAVIAANVQKLQARHRREGNKLSTHLANMLEIDATKQAIEALQISREQDRLLDILPCVKNAAYNSRLWEHSDRCLPDTRVELRKQILEWSEEPSSPPIFWLNGMAGTGKSTIARTIAEEFENKGQLAASFFFSRGSGNLSHAGEFVTTIAVQLANRSKPLKNYICEAVETDRSIASQALRTQWKQLVLLPVSKLHQNTPRARPFLFVVDALDECDGDDDITLLLQFFTGMEGIRVFITSRPETPIRLGFRNMKEIYHRDLALHEISRSIVDQDISTFFRVRFGKIIENSELLPLDWPGEDKIATLVRNAGGLFIYAATICRFIGTQSNQWPPQGLLEAFLPRDQNESGSKLGRSIPSASPTKELDAIYSQILYHSLKGTQEDEDKKTLAARFRQVVGPIVILSEPLSAAALAGLLGVNQDVIHWSLRHLHSVLNVPKDQDSDIRLLHPSFRDFLLDEKRCHDLQFWIDKKMAHQQLAACCLKRLSCSHSGLKLDICNLKHPGISIEEIDPSLATKTIPPEMQYACQYYAQHLQFSEEYQCDGSPVDIFLRRHFLHWLEALSLIGKISQAVHAIALLKSRVDVLKSDGLGLIQSLVSSPNGKIIASASPIYRAVVMLWDTATGAELQAIDTEVTGTVVSRRGLFENLTENQKVAMGRIDDIFISADGNLAAVLSEDRGLHLCDTETGSFLLTLERYSSADEIVVEPIGISTSSKMIASGLEKNLRTTYKHSYTGIILWDTVTGAILRVLRSEGIQFGAGALAFSPNGEKLASVVGSTNKIKLWDTATGAILRARTHADDIYTLSFSPSGKTVALGGRVIKLWDIEADTLLKVDSDNRGVVRCLAFSPDSKVLVSTTTTESKIWFWDTAAMNDAVPQETEVHKSDVNIVVISPHGTMIASTGLDRTVRLWDAKTGTALHVHQCELGDVKVIKFSPDNEAVVYGTNLGSCVVLALSLVTGTFQVLWKVGGYYESITSIAVSPNSKMIACASDDGKIWLWDRATGAALQTFRGLESHSKRNPSSPTEPTDYTGLEHLAFSPDNKTVVLGSQYGTIGLWDTSTGAYLEVLNEVDIKYVRAVAISPDNRIIVSVLCPSDKPDWPQDVLKIWDLKTRRSSKIAWTLWYPRHLGMNRDDFRLAFTADNQRLETKCGLLEIQPRLDKKERPRLKLLDTRIPIRIEEGQISKDGKDYIQFPFYYKMSCFDFNFQHNILALGNGSGELTIIEFN
ncbi:hypothetical protein TWF703_002877 [Orbilia oligospora]|uniref:Mitochondrial division protein 1 n=1 Tax=Orbilia oligospora TaxID=2813651 RepID=A0A7C8PAX9_ORBOL|nr:hypothetical protein TWF703_002877 [Orbilia oligospora]